MRLFLRSLIVLAWPTLAQADTAPAIRPFLETHCVNCHNADDAAGGLDLEALAAKPLDVKTTHNWVKVHDRIRAGEMPPKRKPRPPEADTRTALAAIADSLVARETAQRTENGRTAVRRLNRTEFENTLRDLLDLPGLEVKDLLPDDGRADGYDRSAAALDVSPVYLAKVGEAVDKALDLATAKYSVPPEYQRETMYANQQYDFKILSSGGDCIMLTKEKEYDPRFPLPSATGKYGGPEWRYGGKYAGLGEAEKAGVYKEPSTIGMFRTQDESFQGRFHFAPIHPGRYKIHVSTWAFWWNKGKVEPAPKPGALGVYIGSRLLGHVTAHSLKPTGYTFDAWVDPKPLDSIKVNAASNWNVHLYFSQGQTAAFEGPGVAIDSLTVEGPIHDEWPPESHRRLFGDLHIVPLSKLPAGVPKPERSVPKNQTLGMRNGPGRVVFGTVNPEQPIPTATELLGKFLPRAFRRPVSADEVNRYTKIVESRLADKLPFEDAMKAAYKTALSSPDFLFLNEPKTGPLDDYSIASRLSYFLWNSMPDEPLIQAAASGKLHDPAELRTQTERMLADSRSERFVADFLDQWLDLRDFDATSPDRALYPEYRPLLADAMRKEPREFFTKLLRENRPASSIVDSSFAVANQRLAEHYGLSQPLGTDFKGVGIAKDAHRGGFLTMAAVMKVTANGTTTSPVKRGAWVMRKILGEPPEPPPPNVPAVEPDVRGTTTIREQLAKHRADPSCAGCHANIDPPGFALESFDVIGGLRENYRATEGNGFPDLTGIFRAHLAPDGKVQKRVHAGFRMGPAVDASGTTNDGKEFTGIDEFRKLLLAEPRTIARNLASQLTTYGTGAPVSFADRAAVEAILNKAGGSNPGIRSVILELVQSPLFLTK